MIGGNNTDTFNIGAATVMVGPMEKVLELTPEEHSLGLIKNFNLTTDTTEVSLTQGVRNTEVDSQITGVNSTMSMEVYEYTAANLAYAAQLDGSKFVTSGTYVLDADITGGESASSITIRTDEDVTAKLQQGTTLQLQASSTEEFDKVYIARVESATAGEGTTTITLVDSIPLGWNFKAGDKVFAVDIVPIGSEAPQPYIGVKIVGVLPNGNKPVTIIVPKAKITGGMTLGFSSENYGNLPYEIKPYALAKADALYSTFKEWTSQGNIYVLTGNN